MSDNLKWMNRHAVLLREPQWAGLAARENYRIRADLMPLFSAHPDSADLLEAFAERKLYREGCEFIARMAHRRAAVWWGYCCLLSLFEERQAVAAGRAAQKSPMDGLEGLMADLRACGAVMPNPGDLSPEKIDAFCQVPQPDLRKLLEFPKPPPQDPTALKAATAKTRAGTDRLRSFVPPSVGKAYSASFERAEAATRARFGMTSAERLSAAQVAAQAGRVTYTVDRTSHPSRQALLKLPSALEAKRQETIGQIKAAHPDKFPQTPEAGVLLKAAAKERSDNAVQAVWRWVVSPDERNTTLAMEAGNGAADKPEGLLAYAAAWSFGDLAPEGKITVPVPPELPGTGLTAALLMMALAPDGHRKMPERYELYFKTGLDVVFGKNLWTDAVSEELSPHAKLEGGRK